MARVYCPTRGVYALPRSLYSRMVYLVKDYPRLIDEADALIAATPSQTETPEIQRQRNIKATETANIKYSMLMKDIRDIETALMEAVPPDARTAILESIINNKGYPLDRSRKTYSRYKQRFIYILAERQKLI